MKKRKNTNVLKVYLLVMFVRISCVSLCKWHL